MPIYSFDNLPMIQPVFSEITDQYIEGMFQIHYKCIFTEFLCLDDVMTMASPY